MRRVAVGLLCIVLLAGCMGRTAAPADEAGPTTMAPDVGEEKEEQAVLLVERTGTILLRPMLDLPTHTGDAPCFRFRLPPEVETLAATLDWDVPEPMGVEFHPPTGPRHTSWTGVVQPIEGPVTLVVERPDPGSWRTGAGPGITGAAITYTLTLTITGMHGSEADLAIEELGVC